MRQFFAKLLLIVSFGSHRRRVRAFLRGAVAGWAMPRPMRRCCPATTMNYMDVSRRGVLLPVCMAVSLAVVAAPARAATGRGTRSLAVKEGEKLNPWTGREFVPYARQISKIDIHGDAWTWWQQAEGRYARGLLPRVGAVMALRPYGHMELGHVAVVSAVLDARTILLRHANWSMIGGLRGQIEDNVRAVDVSPANDWSAVRIWFAPLQDLGTTHWPVQGFIYNRKPPHGDAGHLRPNTDDPIGVIIARLEHTAPSSRGKAPTDMLAEARIGRPNPPRSRLASGL